MINRWRHDLGRLFRVYFGKSIVKQHSGLHMIRGHFLLTNVTYLICIVEGRSFLRSLYLRTDTLAYKGVLSRQGVGEKFAEIFDRKKNIPIKITGPKIWVVEQFSIVPVQLQRID